MASGTAHRALLFNCFCWLLAGLAKTARASPPSGVTPAPNVARVSVDLFVMSKCPDAVFCEGFLSPVLQELQQSISLEAHFIGIKKGDGTWQCKHGEEECAGDVQQLCVQQLSKPYTSTKWLLSYMLCNNKDLDATGSFATAVKCLKEAKIPLSAATKMLACMYGPTHQAVLEADLDHTASLGVSTSCTVQFDGHTVAVRDGGKWVLGPGAAERQDFKAALCAAYAARNRGRLPKQCKDTDTSTAEAAAVSASRH